VDQDLLLSAFHRPLRIATAVLAAAGLGLALFGAGAVLAHASWGEAVMFTSIGVVLVAAGAIVLFGHRWAVVIAVVILGAQSIAVPARIWELVNGIDPVKTRQLRHLGIDPALGVTINVIYSAIGAGLFAWFAVRYVAARRTRRSTDALPGTEHQGRGCCFWSTTTEN
jgi:hypothetical protein